MPSGTSAALAALLKLAHLTGDQSFSDQALAVLKLYGAHLSRMPDQFAGLLNVLDFYLSNVTQIAFVLPASISMNEEEKAKEMLFCLHRQYLPNRVILVAREGDKALETASPLARERTAIDGKPTVYICQNYSCEKPITDLNDLKAAIATW